MRDKTNRLFTSRAAGFAYIFGVYVLALIVGVLTFRLLSPHTHLLWSLLWADVAATVVVWLFGALVDNASVYDPYWSVAPPVILTLLAMWQGGPVTLTHILLLTAIWIWGVRLTANWAVTFRSLATQDWRYDKYKAQFPRLWQAVNFAGINLMPTLIVYAAMIPGILLLGTALPANGGTWLGFFVSVGAALLQLVSDRQMHRFRREHSGGVCDAGLWRLSRHPNYLGEILMWWGVWIMFVSVAGWNEWWTAAGALANTLLFVFISIPLMERRQLARKPAYADYCRRTGMLLPRIGRR